MDVRRRTFKKEEKGCFIKYTTTNGGQITPKKTFSTTILSHSQVGDSWVIEFSESAKVPASAFASCTTLKTLEISGITSFGNYSFEYCSNLTNVKLSGTLVDLGLASFNQCISLLYINLPSSLSEIDQQAFYGCSSLQHVYMPNTIKTIGMYAFYGCSGLTSIEIPDSVTSISRQAFYNCSNLTSIYCAPSSPPTGGENMFTGISSSCKIYVPASSVNAYKTATYWSDYSSKIVGYNF